MNTRADAPHRATAQELKDRLETERAGRPYVFYFDGEGRQRIVTLDAVRGRLTIGRAPDADLCLSWDAQVSGLHAELELVGDHWVVADDGLSRNGTYVNQQRVVGRRRLRDGDVIRAGRTVVHHRVPGGPPVASTQLDDRAEVAADQRRVLVALCRPFRGGDAFATPATNPQIAAELYLSVPAVKTHLRTLFAKFGIEDLPQQEKRQRLVAMAFASGLISERDFER
jgi:pSer/pThr/pTyr-binding forkhead associated (FHA) protein